jgi:HD-GYP domain-containing protein (c-di-GMP phosphodiesterase class II)
MITRNCLTKMSATDNNATQNILENIISASEGANFYLSEDVYDQSGNKLLGKGYKVTADIKDKITNRILKKPLETSISSDDSLTEEDIYFEAEKLIKKDKFLASFDTDIQIEMNALKDLEIAPLAALLLTVLKNNHDEALDHTLLMTLIARLIAKKLNFEEDQLYNLTIASLLHDVGELYCSIPATTTLSVENWRSIMTHPIIGSSVVRQHMGYSEFVSLAILEHHERNDGSGYPNHSYAENLSKVGKVLIVAEAFSGMVRKNNDITHLITVLKLAHHDLPSVQLNALIDLLKSRNQNNRGETVNPILDQLLVHLNNLERCIESLKTLSFNDAKLKNISTYIIYRLRRICQTIYASGLTDSIEHGMWDQMKLDGHINLELFSTINEVEWKIKDVFRDLSLRILQSEVQDTSALFEVIDKLKQTNTLSAL